MESLTLDEALRAQRRRHPAGDLPGFAHAFQKKLIKLITSAWTLATSEDYRYVSIEDGRPDRITHLHHHRAR